MRGKEEKNNTKRKRLEEEQSGEEGAALGASNWKSAMRKCNFGVSIRNLDNGTGTDPTFHIALH